MAVLDGNVHPNNEVVYWQPWNKPLASSWTYSWIRIDLLEGLPGAGSVEGDRIAAVLGMPHHHGEPTRRSARPIRARPSTTKPRPRVGLDKD
jgi:hypothetical protein